MRLTPWFTLAAIVIFFILPFGRELVHTSFYSGEQLARSISQALLAIVACIAAGLFVIELGIRYWLRRRAKAAANG